MAYAAVNTDFSKIQQEVQQEVDRQGQVKQETDQRQAMADKIAGQMTSVYTAAPGEGMPSMQEEYLAALKGIKGADLSAYSKYFANIANTQGATQQAQYLTQQQQAQEQAGIEGIQQQSGMESASAYSNLAQQGGASAGARERLGGQMGTQSLFAQQQQRRAGQLARLGILSEDEKRKLDAQAKAAEIDQAQGAQDLQASSLYAQMLGQRQQQIAQNAIDAARFQGSVYGTGQVAQA